MDTNDVTKFLSNAELLRGLVQDGMTRVLYVCTFFPDKHSSNRVSIDVILAITFGLAITVHVFWPRPKKSEEMYHLVKQWGKLVQEGFPLRWVDRS